MTTVRARRVRRVRRVALTLAAAVVLILVVVLVASREARYLLRAAFEESRILLGREPLARLIEDAATPEPLRAKFQLVLETREFARDSLRLAVDGSFAAYADVGRDTLVLVVSASPRDKLEAHLWRYPVVGAVPYKGFFHARAALREAARLRAAGLDTYLRPAGAFSTLGWFDDPLLSTVVRQDSALLVATVLHELAHAAVYVGGAAAFNESFASFVGYRGAEAFFRYRGERGLASRAAAVWRDEKRLGDFYWSLSGRLNALYEGDATGMALATRRDSIFEWARATLRDSLALEAYRGDRLAERELNNASLLAWRLYRTRLGVFDRVLELYHGDVGRALSQVQAAVGRGEGVDPFSDVERAINRAAGTLSPVIDSR